MTKCQFIVSFRFLQKLIFSETFVVLPSNLFFKFRGDDERFQKHFLYFFLFISLP